MLKKQHDVEKIEKIKGGSYYLWFKGVEEPILVMRICTAKKSKHFKHELYKEYGVLEVRIFDICTDLEVLDNVWISDVYVQVNLPA